MANKNGVVKLVSYSKPAQDMIDLGVESLHDLVAFCAKVSNPKNQTDMKNAKKLVKYLKDNSHFSPFEMVHLTIEVNTTRDIARQMLRHRSFAFQEFSQRYAEIDIDSFVLREARLQDTKNRQNSIEVEDDVLQAEWNAKQQGVIDAAVEAYEWALSKGIAKEQARVVLPEGNTASTLFMAGSIRSWIHYIDLRKGNGTQKEHILIAQAIAKVVVEIFGEY